MPSHKHQSSGDEQLPLPVSPAVHPQQQTIQVAHYRRTMTQRAVTYRCAWCSQERTESRYPGPLPRYCGPDCKHRAQNSLAAQRMQAMRERTNPTPRGWRRGPGRPKHA